MTDLTPPRAGRREWIALAILAMATMLVSIDIGALYLALPHLSVDLGAGPTEQLWIADIYGFMTAGFLVTMGTLGDRVGRRRLLLVGAAAFGLLSIAAAYSVSTEMLITTRALLGIAGATLMPSTLALIGTLFQDARQRGMAIAVWVTCLMSGAALGPVIGGVLLTWFWWGSVFLVAVPVMLIVLVAGPVFLPETPRSGGGRLDLPSVLLSLAAILPVIFGIKELAARGTDTLGLAIGTIVVGLLFGVIFVRRQATLSDPLLDLKLFHHRPFAIALLIMVLGSVVLGGVFLLVSQFVQSVLGLSTAVAGLWLAPSAAAMAVGAMLTPVLVRHIRPVRLVAAGLAVSALGFFVLGIAGTLPIVVVGVVLYSIGAGPMLSLGTGLVLGSAPPEKAGSAASLQETANQFGAAAGLAVFGSVALAVYRTRMDTLPAGLSATEAETARQNVASAVAVAAQVGGDTGADLLRTASDAYAASMNVGAAIGGFIVLGLAVLVATQLRGMDSSGSVAVVDAEDERRAAPTEAGQA